ncbi:carbohydrate ABC transporter membrane protein 1 (CUT1 family) [Paenibacillus cellulosilyticus]|uniref:Carbohydrate ABC transporter membrane protein 1 (CUT1 family) n=1 Tax=Paenibacillus cellulosilyticus TaxID=375489 RepID=A0A2V2YH11_9BACL|nr:sugar ABC transporter permease [Paenibacillus cellulosilyticus]PWV90542.1 carbohydrate ABC transporter membrane protein 1 (CUT1 family) [Paenibacillus cellulosilyticus]
MKHNAVTTSAAAQRTSVYRPSIMSRLKRDKWMYALLLPGLIYFLVFKYVPMWGVLLAFKNYQPFLGFWKSEWVGFEHFRLFFTNPDFFMLLRNTLVLSFYNLIFFFPAPIIAALMLNEVRIALYKRAVQTLIYVPHFISMVIVASLTYVFLTTEGGPVNEWLSAHTGKTVDFLTSPDWFRPLIIIQTIWKECGWGTIIFLAALAAVDVEQYEAAIVDGANRLRQLWHITLPALRSTIVILLILRMGHVLDNGFEQIYLMLNPLNRENAEVFDTYVYMMGITQGAFSYSTAVGLFKSVVGVILVLGTNWLAKRFGQSGLY